MLIAEPFSVYHWYRVLTIISLILVITLWTTVTIVAMARMLVVFGFKPRLGGMGQETHDRELYEDTVHVTAVLVAAMSSVIW